MTPSIPPLRVLVIGAGVGGLSVARGLLRDGHDVTVFEQGSAVRAQGGAVTIWSNGAAVLEQLGVDMSGAGELLSSVRVVTPHGRRLATLNVAAIESRLGAPVRMVPRRMLLERLLNGFPMDRIRCNARVTDVVENPDCVVVNFADHSSATGDLVIGADGRRSFVRHLVGASQPHATGWCSWQGLVRLPEVAEDHVAMLVVGPDSNLGLWPAGNSELQWWFDLPWTPDFVRPDHPIDLIRSQFAGWSDSVDQVLAALTDSDLDHSPYPHYRHPIPRMSGRLASHRPVTLLGDAAHTMPPTLAQGTNQALLDTMVLCHTLSHRTSNADVAGALRNYERVRRRRVAAVSHVASLQVSHGESVLKPAELIPDSVMTWMLMTFLRAVSHRRMSATIGRELAARRVNSVGGLEQWSRE